METIDYYQILIFLIQGFIVASIVLTIFRLRKAIGLSVLFTVLGLFQFIQVFLASTIYFKISDTLIISPGSSVLFSVTLFTVLLIYIKEDAIITRKLINALVITNLILCYLLFSFRLNIEGAQGYNGLNISIDFIYTNFFLLLVGSIILYIDSILLLFTFEFISKYTKSLFLRIFSTMSLILSFDAVVFTSSSFWFFDDFVKVMYSGLISKVVMSFFYSILFMIYLRYFEKEDFKSSYLSFKDIFHTFTYRQKFEVAEKAMHLTESRYDTLTDSVPVGIFRADTEGKTIFVNPKWSELSGVSFEEALENSRLNTVHPDDRNKVIACWQNREQQPTKSEREYRFLRPDGTIKWVLGLVIPEYNDKNELIGYVGTVTDITEIKLFEIELSRLKLKAEESDLLKSAFLANMSHEVRTPINGILGLTELLRRKHLDDKDQKLYIDLIQESGKRMLDILSDILNVSEIEANRTALLLDSVNVNLQTTEVFNLFKPETNKKQIDFDLYNDLSNECAIIETDKDKLRSILINLIKNAIKYTQKGKIEFGYKKRSNFLEFYVTDTGSGIDDTRQEAIFDKFVQEDLSDNYSLEGTGLGLSIAKAYVEMLNGKIWLKSEKNKGSTFYFSIPYTEEEEEEEKDIQNKS